jgi:hypothetical protein
MPKTSLDSFEKQLDPVASSIQLNKIEPLLILCDIPFVPYS